jgi:signal transduction histidine kinase
VITAVRDDDGAVSGFSKVTRDVTERRRAEEALETARAEAERASRAKSEFLSRMSHELRTPLTAILGFDQLLEMDRDDLTDDQRHAVDQIGRAGRHLLGMIDEVLDIARIEAGGQALTLEDLALEPLVREAVALTEPQAQASGVAITIDVSPDVRVRADRRAALQIVLNLLSNAVKYSTRGGSVSVTSRHDGDRVVVEVEDEGPGIAPEVAHRLFTPFDRLDAERWSGAPGSGLGLALSRGLARALGGDLDHSDRASASGAIFRLGLLAAPEEGVGHRKSRRKRRTS